MFFTNVQTRLHSRLNKSLQVFTSLTKELTSLQEETESEILKKEEKKNRLYNDISNISKEQDQLKNFKSEISKLQTNFQSLLK